MDPVSHSILGIACALAVTRRPEYRRPAALAGMAGGLWPDADIFLQSAADPMFTLEYHRHFTHGIGFTPVIALIAAASAWLILRLFRQRTAFRPLLLPGFIAACSHIFCDLWTSYGTRALWPFSQERLALDWISVVDPLMTLPLLILVLWAVFRKSRRLATIGLGWAAFYLSLCVIQHHRAMTALEGWIASRGHTAERITVKPSFANIVVWRGLYLAGGEYHCAAIRPGLPGDVRLKAGESTPWLAGPADASTDWQGLPAGSTAVNDVIRFYHFSSGWVSWNPVEGSASDSVLGDLRYAKLPYTFGPLWGIGLHRENPARHADWLTFRDSRANEFVPLWELIRGNGF